MEGKLRFPRSRHVMKRRAVTQAILLPYRTLVPLLVGRPETRDQVSLYTTVMRHALVRCSPVLEQTAIAIDEYLW